MNSFFGLKKKWYLFTPLENTEKFMCFRFLQKNVDKTNNQTNGSENKNLNCIRIANNNNVGEFRCIQC